MSTDSQNIGYHIDDEADGAIPLQPIPGEIPEEMKKMPHWCLWRLESRDGKPTKIPYQITLAPARSNDPTTWASFEEVMAKCSDQIGIGFFFSGDTPYAGLDWDHCVEDGVIRPDVLEELEALRSYSEFSVSGKGIHAILKLDDKGALPKGMHGPTGREFYSAGRYFTVTGHRVPGTPPTIEPRQVFAEEFVRKHGPQKTRVPRAATSTPTQKPSGAKAMTASPEEIQKVMKLVEYYPNHKKFKQLWAGDWEGAGYPSQSEADLALCSILATYGMKDPAWVDKLFRASGLYREKWDRRHDGSGATYGEMTVSRAVQVNEPPSPGPNVTPSLPYTSPSTSGGSPVAPTAPGKSFQLTDLGNAERFVTQHGNRIRYAHDWGKWLIWDGTRWKKDAEGEIYGLASLTVRSIYAEANATVDDERRTAIAKHALRSEGESRISAMISLAQNPLLSSPALPRVAVTSAIFDLNSLYLVLRRFDPRSCWRVDRF